MRRSAFRAGNCSIYCYDCSIVTAHSNRAAVMSPRSSGYRVRGRNRSHDPLSSLNTEVRRGGRFLAPSFPPFAIAITRAPERLRSFASSSAAAGTFPLRAFRRHQRENPSQPWLAQVKLRPLLPMSPPQLPASSSSSGGGHGRAPSSRRPISSGRGSRVGFRRGWRVASRRRGRLRRSRTSGSG